MQKCSVAVVHFNAVGDVVKQNEEYENEYQVLIRKIGPGQQ